MPKVVPRSGRLSSVRAARRRAAHSPSPAGRWNAVGGPFRTENYASRTTNYVCHPRRTPVDRGCATDHRTGPPSPSLNPLRHFLLTIREGKTKTENFARNDKELRNQRRRRGADCAFICGYDLGRSTSGGGWEESRLPVHRDANMSPGFGSAGLPSAPLAGASTVPGGRQVQVFWASSILQMPVEKAGLRHAS